MGRFFLLIQPNGVKIWRLAYRFEGRQKLLSGGPYPTVTLVAARAWREAMQQQLALGLDPSEEWRNDKMIGRERKRARHKFEDVAREWLETRLGRHGAPGEESL